MKNVTCYGTGVIGTAWGATFLKGNCNVTFYDIDTEKLDDTKTNLEEILSFFCTYGMMTAEAKEKALKSVTYTTDVKTAVEHAELIQENCPEKIELKQSVLKLIEAHCPKDTIIASSTSGLLLSDISKNAVHPERVICAHPYNPVYVMPLVEISTNEQTDAQVVEKAVAFYKGIGKEPVVLKKESPGFLCNRIQVAVIREAYDLVHRGVCSVEDIDKAVTYGVGLRWAILGPHLVNHLGGGAAGFRGINAHLAGAMKTWLEDMAKWSDIPEGYIDVAEEGIKEEMANRPKGTGNNEQELGAYLNQGVLEILKYHKLI
ncbi:3-hydroxyacyl-CoA dehydrogenase family protein [Fusibacter paucivorans]|uniref:L-gulonate 3-dehydrogenase n=1 Tax=Fusibacter paucivorans TaxID=76009 RepID=A0ABS5PTU4_9FIRM|nr:3-hydroxyacyl-CoA dehydrogenase family protein [Fusibacter paucivorans]MBS7527809.1 3-hydroxyacyl-CoA dehydrogenase family protein [Fusibacter paucivorans]